MPTIWSNPFVPWKVSLQVLGKDLLMSRLSFIWRRPPIVGIRESWKDNRCDGKGEKDNRFNFIPAWNVTYAFINPTRPNLFNILLLQRNLHVIIGCFIRGFEFQTISTRRRYSRLRIDLCCLHFNLLLKYLKDFGPNDKLGVAKKSINILVHLYNWVKEFKTKTDTIILNITNILKLKRMLPHDHLTKFSLYVVYHNFF